MAAALGSCVRRETAVQRGDRAQVLERGSGAEVTSLDPQLAMTVTQIDIDSALFEGLTAEDPTDLHPVPAVAERWERSRDGTTYTFHLRPSAKWSDGTPVTASDFVESWRRILTPALAAPNADLLYILRGAEAYHRGRTGDFSTVGAEALDPQTLQVRLKYPAPYFLSLLSHPAWMPVPIRIIAKRRGVADRGNDWAEPGSLVGNGPFVLKQWRRNQVLVVEKSPTYWDAARVRLHAIRFHPFDSMDAEEMAFRSGQLHVTYELPFGKADVYRRKKPALLRSDPYLNTFFLRLNTRHAPLDNALVRRALALAIDRTALVESVLRGGQRPATAITPPGLPRYTPPDGPGFNPSAARRLLARAGYADGRGFPPMELLYDTSENLRTVGEAIQEMWRSRLGINVRLVNREFRVVLAERSAGRYQILLSDWVGDYLDPTTFLDPWTSGAANNLTGWSDDRYDRLLADAEGTRDRRRRDAELKQAEELLVAAAPVIPLYYNAHTYLLRPSVKGWYPTLLDHHPYKDVWLATRSAQN